MSNYSIKQLSKRVSAQVDAFEETVRLARAVVATKQLNKYPDTETLSEIVNFAEQLDNPNLDLGRIFHDLLYRIELADLLHGISKQIGRNPSIDAVFEITADAIWQKIPLRFVVAVSGESELGPYIYRSMRGVAHSEQYVGEICPFPLWGILARALLPRLDVDGAADRPGYLIVDNIAAEGVQPIEFPWIEKGETLAIFPLRVYDSVVGGLLLGRDEVNAFDDLALCESLQRIATSVARDIWHTQIRNEMISRASQAVGLQLFTRAIAPVQDVDEMFDVLGETIPEVIEAASVFLIFVDLFPDKERGEPPLPSELVDNLGIFLLYDSGDDEIQVLSPQILELAVWVFQAAQPVFFDPSSLGADNVMINHQDLFYNEEGNALLVPVMIGDEVLSVFYVSSTNSNHRFNEDDMVVLRTMTNSIAGALCRL